MESAAGSPLVRVGRVMMTASLFLAGAPAASAQSLPHREFAPTSFLLSRSAAGTFPNGPSCCAAISHDERIARVMAFESLATDVTPGVRVGIVNVYAVFRRPPWALNGSPWIPGRPMLLSHGLAGAPANGSSYAVALSGGSGQPPRCAAFISTASNLVPGVRGRRARAYVEDLASQRITLISVGSHGQQANRGVVEVAIDGACTRAAFVTAASNLTLSARDASRWRGARTSAPRRGTSQAYLRFLPKSTAARSLAGLTLLVSGWRGHPASTGASQISLSRNGTAIAFVSNAANLSAASNGISQVWETTVTASGGTSVKTKLRLVSSAGPGSGGDGPSTDPSISHDGAHVAFETLANLTGVSPLAVTQVALASLAGQTPTFVDVSEALAYRGQRAPPAPGDAPSYDPSITDGGEWVFYDSRASNLAVTPRAPQREVYRWTTPALQTASDLSGIEMKSLSSVSFPSLSPAEHPATSARGNYLAFEAEDPWIDAAALVSAPTWTRMDATALQLNSGSRIPYPGIPFYLGMPRSQLTGLIGADGHANSALTVPSDPRLHQVYVRYLGPQ